MSTITARKRTGRPATPDPLAEFRKLAAHYLAIRAVAVRAEPRWPGYAEILAELAASRDDLEYLFSEHGAPASFEHARHYFRRDRGGDLVVSRLPDGRGRKKAKEPPRLGRAAWPVYVAHGGDS
jgi:hypothetical protein